MQVCAKPNPRHPALPVSKVTTPTLTILFAAYQTTFGPKKKSSARVPRIETIRDLGSRTCSADIPRRCCRRAASTRSTSSSTSTSWRRWGREAQEGRRDAGNSCSEWSEGFGMSGMSGRLCSGNCERLGMLSRFPNRFLLTPNLLCLTPNLLFDPQVVWTQKPKGKMEVEQQTWAWKNRVPFVGVSGSRSPLVL